MIKQLAIFLLALSVLFFSQCKKDSEPIVYDCSNNAPRYNNAVRNIVDVYCAFSGCHNSSSRAAGIDLSSYAALRSEASRARFMGSVEHRSGFSPMPRGGRRLSETDLNTLACWIQNGYLE